MPKVGPLSPGTEITVFFAVLTAYLIILGINRGLHRFPGPFLAKFTNLWRYFDVRNGHHHITMVRLHRRHGDVVRIGPNSVSICDPAAIPLIYGVSRGFVKSDFYDAFQSRTSGKVLPMLFPIKDESLHQRIKKPIAGNFAMSSLVKFEPAIDQVINLMVERLADEFASKAVGRKACNMDDWVQYFSFDVITRITFGEYFGFLNAGRDLHDLMHRLDQTIDEDAPISQMPWLGYFHKKNPLARIRKVDSSPFVSFIASRIQAGKRRWEGMKSEGRDVASPLEQTFLDHFLDAQSLHKEAVDDSVVWCYTLTNFVAGSDTVAIPLRSVLYYVLSDAAVYARLIQELEGAHLSIPVAWNEARRLPYLDAVIQEALRIHPPVGLGPERIVPPGGLRLSSGLEFAGGTQVSINAWAMHRCVDSFGVDPDKYRPERWLPVDGESSTDFETRLGDMRRASFTFGFGSRMCIGKNLSLIEIYKLIPTLFLCLDMKIAKAEWKTWNSWFVRQKGLDIYLERKTPTKNNN